MIEISVTLGFAAVCAAAYVAVGAGAAIAAAYAALLHELAHCLASELCGANVRRLRLSVCGAEIISDCSLLSYGKEIFCIAAGPAANFVCGALLSLLAIGETAYLFAGINITMALFNLIPARGFDGGRILSLCIPSAEPYISAASAAVLAAAGIYAFAKTGLAVSLLVFAAYVSGIILYNITKERSRRKLHG